MRSTVHRRLIAVLFLLGSISLANAWSDAKAQSANKPLTRRELMALVAGGSVSEDIAHDIASRGLSFRFSDEDRSRLTAAGAAAPVFAALRNAKATASGESNVPDPSLRCLATAAQLIRSMNYQGANQELTSALQAGARSEAAFVMGQSLVLQQRWPEAATIYEEVLRESPDFNAAHVKASYVFFRLGDYDNALREAQAGLEKVPESAEAHKNRALALASIKKFEAAEEDYKQALRLKPNYAAAHGGMGLLYYDWGKWDEAIAENRKSISLDSTNPDVHYNLGLAYRKKGDVDSAIREFREAARLNPSFLEAREALGNDLASKDPSSGVKELRDLTATAPNDAQAHADLGIALFEKGDYKAAEAEDRKAVELDPSHWAALANLGHALQQQGRYDEAIAAFLQSERLNPECGCSRRGLGIVYFELKKYDQALSELRTAIEYEPGFFANHDWFAQALTATGDLDGAISEYRQAIRLEPRAAGAMSRLAAILEKRGDPKGALELYRQAAQVQPDAQYTTAYAEAEKRLGVRLDSVQTAKKPAKSKYHPAQSVPTNQLESAWHQAFAEGQQAAMAGNLADAEPPLQYALALAERLTPRDDRLLNTQFNLGMVYLRQNKLDEGKEVMQRELQAIQEIYGPQSKQVVPTIEMLGGIAEVKNDYSAAETLYLQAFDLNEKFNGPADPTVELDLTRLGRVDQLAKTFDKAEPMFLRALAISDSISQGHDDNAVSESYVANVLNLYIAWGKFDKAEPYARRVLAMRERQYGHDSRMVVSSLQTLIDVLSKTGQTEEADNLRRRAEAIAGVQSIVRP